MKNKKETMTEENFELKFYPRETKTVSLEISADVFEVLKKKAEERDMPLKALLKFYVGQGLRNDLSEEEAKELALKRLKSRRNSKQDTKIDLAA